ncbi:MAG: hypothetical protein ACREOU_08030 [Candidatus Eiseniibacteriota bacterium]
MSALGKIWTSPNTVLGVTVGAVAVMLGARAQRGRNAIEFLDNPFVALLGVRAVTLGNTIHYAPGWGPDDFVTRYDGSARIGLGQHEESHTLQYERWGPLFLPVYFVCWLPWIPPSGNRFEHAADDRAERIAAAAGAAGVAGTAGETTDGSEAS